MNFSTTYYTVHDRLGRQQGPGVKRPSSMPYSYNIITGKKEFHSNIIMLSMLDIPNQIK